MRCARTIRCAVCAMLVSLLPSVGARAQDWARVTAPGTGVSVDMPVDIFTENAGPTRNPPGYTYRTPDKRADLSVYALPSAGRSPADFLRTNFNLPVSSITYQRITPSMVTVSGYRGDKIWYARCNFSAGLARCVGLNYPAGEKRRWDDIVTRISHSLSRG